MKRKLIKCLFIIVCSLVFRCHCRHCGHCQHRCHHCFFSYIVLSFRVVQRCVKCVPICKSGWLRNAPTAHHFDLKISSIGALELAQPNKTKKPYDWKFTPFFQRQQKNSEKLIASTK